MITDVLKKRRTIYALSKNIDLKQEEVEAIVKDTVELVPDAFNMRSQRVVLATGAKQDELWDKIYDAFEGKVAREKIDGFKTAYGTVLYFIDENVVKGLQDAFPLYAANFPVWAQQSNGMLQFTLWNRFTEAGLGANIQHYNPVINDAVRTLFDLPESWTLVAQMPFGKIEAEAGEKQGEDVNERVIIAK